MSEAEKQFTELTNGLKKIGDQIKSQAEKTNKELSNYGKVQEETRATVDELLMKQGELQTRLLAAEQRLAADSGNDNTPEMRQSMGDRVLASEGADRLSSSWKGSHRVEMLRNEITSASDSAGATTRPDYRGIVPPQLQRMTIRDLVAPGQTDSNSVEYTVETGFTNNAAAVPEGGPKPYSDIQFALENAPVRTIAHMFKASRQILDDAAGLRSYIDGRSTYGLLLKEELQLLFGDGTGQNLHGIVPQAQEFNPNFAPQMETAIDRIRLAMLQATLAEYPTDGIVLNPIDWAVIETLKDTQGRYIIGNPANGTTPLLWNRPVVETQAMVNGQFLTGAFRMAAQIYDRMQIEVLLSTENDKDFENNMVSIRAEERLAFAVYRPEAFVTGSIAPSSGGE